MGFGMRGAVWSPQLETLPKHHRVCYFDNRGVGQSDETGRFLRMEELAEDTSRVLDELGWRSAHLVGVSMGGMVAQELALREQRRFRSLTLIATHAGGVRACLPKPNGLRYFAIANMTRRQRRFEALERLLYPESFLKVVDKERMRKRMGEQVGHPAPKATALAQISAVVRHRTRRRLAGIRLPTLIIRPGKDILINPKNSDVIHKAIPQSRLLRIDDAGHGAVFQSARKINEALLDHFRAADERTQEAQEEKSLRPSLADR